MIDLEDFLPRVMQVAPACPEPLAIEKIRDAARTFLRRTRLWRRTDSFAVDLSDAQAIVPYENADVFEIYHASFMADGVTDKSQATDLVPITLADLDRDHFGWRSDEGPPEFITQVNIDTLRLVPKAKGTLDAELILVPSARTPELPDVLMEKFEMEICEGAIAEVLAMPGDFQNPQRAIDARARFQGYLDTWGARASQGQMKARRRTRMASTF